MKLLMFFICALILLTPGVSAHDSSESLISPGIYSENACTDESEILIYVAGREIWFGEYIYVSNMQPTGEVVKGGWQPYGEGVFGRMSQGDGIEWLYWTGEGKPKSEDLVNPPSDKTRTGEFWKLESFRKCESLPLRLSVPHGEPISFLLQAHEVVDRCAADHLKCAKGLFDIADRHPDGELTVAEWSRVIRTAVYLGVLSEEEEIKHGTTLTGFGASLVAAPLLAKALIASFDYDGDGKTSLKELSHDLMLDDLTRVVVSGDLDDKTRAQIEQIISNAKDFLPLLMGVAR